MQTKKQTEPRQQDNDLQDPSNSKNSGLNTQDDQALRSQDISNEDEEDEENDDTPDMDEADLEENDLSDEEADNIEWDPKQGKDKDQ